VLYGARLEGHISGAIVLLTTEIDGTKGGKPIKLPNPEHAKWFSSDQ
jgi:hypothetical protein